MPTPQQLETCGNLVSMYESDKAYARANNARLSDSYVAKVSAGWERTGCPAMGFRQIPSND